MKINILKQKVLLGYLICGYILYVIGFMIFVLYCYCFDISMKCFVLLLLYCLYILFIYIVYIYCLYLLFISLYIRVCNGVVYIVLQKSIKNIFDFFNEKYENLNCYGV